MAFSIKFLDTPVPKERLGQGEEAVFGLITIGEFSERTIIPIHYWSKEDYLKQWVDGVQRILSSNHDISALFTEMYDPRSKRYPNMCWALYKEGETIYVQNYYEPLDKLKHPFQLKELYPHILKREIPDMTVEDPISEWTISVTELGEWLTELSKIA